MNGILVSFIRNRVFANVLLAIIIIAGLIATFMMVREFFPETSIDMISVSIIFPGADPEEVEEGISRKIEEAVEGKQGVKRCFTTSAESVSSAMIEVADGYDIDEVYDRVRNAIDSISTFPRSAEQPVLSKVMFTDGILWLALWGDQDERTLKEWAEKLKDEMQALPGLSQVNVQGTRNYEISIEISEEKLREYGMSFQEVSNAVRQGSLNLSGGSIRTLDEQIRVRTVGRKYTGKDFASIIVRENKGANITLDRVAKINDGFVEDAVYTSYNGQPCALLGIYKTSEEDAIAIAKTVRNYIDERQQTLPAGMNVSVWNDRSIMIRDRINLLSRNGLIGLILVFFLLWLFLDLRLSFWVAMGIPISLSGTLVLMWGLGETINMISLFGMIMVLGIVVDDAIVVGEAIYTHRKKGDGPLKAAVSGVKEVGMPVIAAVTTTITAFIPLLFIGGVMGKLISVLPVAVISALLVSLVECLFLLPAHLNHLPDMNAPIEMGHPWKLRARHLRRRISYSIEWFIEHIYQPFVSMAIRWRYIALSIAIAVLLITIGMAKGGLIKYVMFPKLDGNDVAASIEFPVGTPTEKTQEAIEKMQRAIERVAQRLKPENGKPLIKNIFAVSGQSGQSFQITRGSHVGQVQLELLPTEERNIHYTEIVNAWEKEVGVIPGALSQKFIGFHPGPPGGDIEIWLLGENMDELLAISEQAKEKLRTYDGISQVSDDYRPGKNELQIDIKPEARALGLTLDDLAKQVYAGFYGDEAVRIQRGRDDVRVKVRYTENERKTMADIEQVRIRTPQGNEVPFFSVADVKYGRGYSSITRVDGHRRVSISGEIDSKKANADEILQDLSKTFIPAFKISNPEVRWAFEGAKKNDREAMGTLKFGFPLALIGIYVIIATVFRSYLQPLVIMVTVPFGIIGAVYGHLLMGFELTMLSMFGLVALSGVVVNDAIVLIECINRLMSTGVPFFDALRVGGARRFRAIFLTTASTCGALTPLILEKDVQAQFLIPMALSIASGVAFATILTLVLIPCLLGILNDIKRVAFAVSHGYWPEPEAVEPAVTRDTYLMEEEIPTSEVMTEA